MKVYLWTHKSGNSSWCADLGIVAGKRKRSLHATRAEANTVLRNAQDVGRCNVLTPEQTREFLSAQQRLAAPNRTIGEAVDFLLSRSDVIKEAITVLELADRCAASKLLCGRRPETTRSLQKAARQLSAYLDIGKMADTVCRTDIEGFLSQSGYAPKTRNNFLGEIASLWAWGRARGHVGENPAAGLDRAKLDTKPITFLTVQECKALLRETQRNYSYLMGFIALSLFAGIRPVELTRMSWSFVDLDAGIVAVEGEFAKTRARRVVRLEPVALAWLSACERRPGGKIVPMKSTNFRNRLAKLRATVGRWPDDVARHTFATMHYGFYRDEARLQVELGHRSGAMLHANYRGLLKNPKDAEEFWNITPAKVISTE